jgi:hypothetical protein
VSKTSIVFTAATVALLLNLAVLLERPVLAQSASRTFVPLGAYQGGTFGNAAWFLDATQQKVYVCSKASPQGGFSCEGVPVAP